MHSRADQRRQRHPRHNALASRVIIEVLSPTTEQNDRGDKWQHYQLIPSLQEYVLVSQPHPRVEHYRRLASGGWEYHDGTSLARAATPQA